MMPFMPDTANGFFQPGFEALLRTPSELAPDLADVHRIAQVVAGAVGDELDQVGVAAAFPRARAVERGAERAHHIEVAALALAADVVGLADAPLLEHQADRLAMVVDVEPVAAVFAVAVDR